MCNSIERLHILIALVRLLFLLLSGSFDVLVAASRSDSVAEADWKSIPRRYAVVFKPTADTDALNRHRV